MAANIYDWSLTAADNATADSGLTWAEGQAPSTVNNSARVMMERIAELLADIGGTLSAGGTANGITVTANSAFTTYANGRMLAFKATADNTGAVTLNVNSIGTKAIRRMGSSGDEALGAGMIENGGIYIVQYSTAANGGAGAWLLVNPVLDSVFQAKDTDLTAIAALTSAADKMPYATGSGTWAMADLTSFARSILDDADAATVRSTTGTNDASNLTTGTLADARLPTTMDGKTFTGVVTSSFSGVTQDKISLFEDRLGATNMYGFGVESGYLYAKSGITGHRWYIAANADGGTSDEMELTTSGLTVNGDITAASDENLKKDIRTFSTALETVQKLRGVRYRRKDTGKEGVGFIAQEVEIVLPELVHENGDGVKSVAYGNFVAVLVEAVKELSERVGALEGHA